MVITTTRTTDTELIETGEKRDALGRRHTPAARRAELLAAYRASGLTQSAFARREGITYSTFCTWAQAERRRGELPPAPAGRKRRRRVGSSPAMRPPQRVNFAEVRLPSTPLAVPGLEVRLPDGTLLRGGNVIELAALVRALRA
jgi:transposase-like protein